MHFSCKTIFFFQLIAAWFWFCCFLCICFLWVLFHGPVIMKLRIALLCIYAYSSFLFDLSSNLKSCGITKEFKNSIHVVSVHGMVTYWLNYRLLLLKLFSCFWVFLVSKETKFEIDTTSIILSYLYHFRNVNKELFRYY